MGSICLTMLHYNVRFFHIDNSSLLQFFHHILSTTEPFRWLLDVFLLLWHLQSCIFQYLQYLLIIFSPYQLVVVVNFVKHILYHSLCLLSVFISVSHLFVYLGGWDSSAFPCLVKGPPCLNASTIILMTPFISMLSPLRVLCFWHNISTP